MSCTATNSYAVTSGIVGLLWVEVRVEGKNQGERGGAQHRIHFITISAHPLPFPSLPFALSWLFSTVYDLTSEDKWTHITVNPPQHPPPQPSSFTAISPPPTNYSFIDVAPIHKASMPEEEVRCHRWRGIRHESATFAHLSSNSAIIYLSHQFSNPFRSLFAEANTELERLGNARE